jgi:hypothetical protein
METKSMQQQRGPNPGITAIVFMVLFNTGLSFVISLSGKPPYYPGPWETAQVIETYFRNHAHEVSLCGFFQFIAAVPLAILTVTLTSRLRFLGNPSPGPYIAMAGGLLTAVSLALSALILWVMAYPGIAQNGDVLRTLYYLGFAIGGAGYSVPLGLLIAGVAVSAGFMKILPRGLVITGVVLAFIGEASCLSLVFPKLLPLIPLTRFLGFIWLIIAGFKLPRKLPA